MCWFAVCTESPPSFNNIGLEKREAEISYRNIASGGRVGAENNILSST